MATVPPRPSKKQKLAAETAKQQEAENDRIPEGLGNIRVQFLDETSGDATGAPVTLPLTQASTKNLELLLNSLLQNDESDRKPYRFSLRPEVGRQGPVDVANHVFHSIIRPNLKSTEDLITLQYTPQAVFKVRAVTRCSAAISGHGQPILSSHFSPVNSSRVVTGSGDGTARIWDCDTGTPFQTLKGHTSWVLAVCYSPDGQRIATGSMDNTVRIWTWDAQSKSFTSSPLKGHTKWITSLAWEPYHLQDAGRPRLASSSKDSSVKVWDVTAARVDINFTRHQASVSCVRWAGGGIICSASHDKTVKIWDSKTGNVLKNLTAHAHWVNHVAISTEAVLRTGYLDRGGNAPSSESDKQSQARQLFETAARHEGKIVERLVTASDDCTMFLWNLTDLSKPVARMTGHQKQVNHVSFSPDGRYIASCGFDNHVKLWDGHDGKFLKTMRGHVAPVYQCCFSADSRLVVSASKDTTIKAWDVRTGTLVEDLPGHKDEVFAVDWSPDGKRVASGGKDKQVRIWSH